MEFKEIKKVSDLGDEYMFLSDSQDVNSIKESIGTCDEYDSFFIKLGDGDYDEVWGMCGIVPLMTKNVYKLV